MYCIIKDGVEIAAVDKLRYIRLNERNGCYVLTTEEQAQGIAVQGTPYNLFGRTPMEGLETVAVIERDELVSQADLAEVKETAENPDPDTAGRLKTLEAQNAALTTSNQFLEDCLVEMAGIIYA